MAGIDEDRDQPAVDDEVSNSTGHFVLAALTWVLSMIRDMTMKMKNSILQTSFPLHQVTMLSYATTMTTTTQIVLLVSTR